MAVMDALIANARKKQARIVFPEGSDERIALASAELEIQGIAHPIVIRESDITEEAKSAYARALSGSSGMPVEILEMMLAEPLNFASAMVAVGDADGLVAGLGCATTDVILTGQMLIGLLDGISIPSSFFIMELDDKTIGEEGCLVFADCAVTVQPSADELADIAITTAKSARNILGWEPRVAMLSFSSHGSAVHDDVTKVTQALEKVQNSRIDLAVDGEFQVDTALVASVASSKIKRESAVAGKANVLIFPDLDAGNAGYKLVQRLAKASSYGPVLQGFKKPVSDLSRGATVEDIVGASILVAAQVQRDVDAT